MHRILGILDQDTMQMKIKNFLKPTMHSGPLFFLFEQAGNDTEDRLKGEVRRMSETTYIRKIDGVIRFIVETKLYISTQSSFMIEMLIYTNLSALLINLVSISLFDTYTKSSKLVDDGLDKLQEIREKTKCADCKVTAMRSYSPSVSTIVKDTSRMVISFGAIRLITILVFASSLLLAVVPIINALLF